MLIISVKNHVKDIFIRNYQFRTLFISQENVQLLYPKRMCNTYNQENEQKRSGKTRSLIQQPSAKEHYN